MKKTILNLIVSILVGLIVLIVVENRRDKIVVVDAVRLFNGFKMKIELEERDKLKLKILAKKTDSLENVLKVMQRNMRESELDRRTVYEYEMSKSNLQQEFELSNREINEQVWKRLNVLIADFGKENKIQIIAGANGMGAVLYNDKSVDWTDKSIHYVNDIYENKN